MQNRHGAISADTRLELTTDVLDVGATYAWAAVPSCGAVVVFSGIVRDHAEGRNGVSSLTYEAYEGQVVPRLRVIAEQMRKRWQDLGRIALIHRVGDVALAESSVLVVVSAPHREHAFAAARFGIDSLKVSVPIWKQEHWAGGTDWATNSSQIAELL